MFTGIVEACGDVLEIVHNQKNIHYYIKSPFLSEIYIDQSIAHNGVCLTVDEIKDDRYRVTAIDETLQKSNLGNVKVGHRINLERCMKMGGRLDGHIVQGHVDTTTLCTGIEDKDGSWLFTFSMPHEGNKLIVDKGSICINGVSLTVVDPTEQSFQVAIIPYTYEHTSFSQLNKGDRVNIEFDILGKYVLKNLSAFAQMGG